MNAAPSQPAPTLSWFAPLDPALGPSDPPQLPAARSRFAPPSVNGAAWTLWIASTAGCALTLLAAQPFGTNAAHFWSYLLTTLAAIRFVPKAVVPVEPRAVEDGVLFGLCLAAMNVAVFRQVSWVGQELALSSFASCQLFAAWLSFHRTRLSLPRQF